MQYISVQMGGGIGTAAAPPESPNSTTVVLIALYFRPVSDTILGHRSIKLFNQKSKRVNFIINRV